MAIDNLGFQQAKCVVQEEQNNEYIDLLMDRILIA
jgi:hypothetical protein